MDKQILNDYTKAIRSSYEPYYIGFAMHPEEGQKQIINEELEKINNDLIQIDNALISAGNQVYKLMTNTILRLNNINDSIKAEKERYQDVQMLCNKYNDYDNAKLLSMEDFTGTFSYKNGDFSAKITKDKTVKLQIVNVSGNGYEGNKYVYKDYKYTNTVLDTSVRNNMVDGKETSYYEYSRITIGNLEDVSLTDFNKDNKEATCTITFQAEEPVNEIEILSDDSDIIITDAAYSLDGIEFISINLPYISINNKMDSYGNYGYIYGSGKLVFPERTNLFKVTLQSNGYKNDIIAYQKELAYYYHELNAEEGLTIEFTDENVQIKTEEVTTIVNSGQRHVIKINEINAYLSQYEIKSKMQSKELLNQDVYAISVFANVYIPEGLSSDAVRFVLTVNGYNYEVVPINSHLNGIKIIRFSTGNSGNGYTERIGEKIKSAYLTVTFANKNRCSPIVNNIKILLGGEI